MWQKLISTPYGVISKRVATAIREQRPVVALESTIITHGMAYPHNVETATAVEKIVEDHGCTPATIALINGKVHVGLETQEIELLGKTGSVARKATTRDIPSLLASKGIGSTTVAATSAIAAAIGIDVFVTGGIGGVHRGVEHTWDVSADLNELGRTPITVVCAGVKSILDIPKTLEYLETQGVAVMTLNSEAKEAEFPAFFTPKSGVKSPETVHSIESLAEIVRVHRELGMPGGQVVAVPNPEPAEGAVVAAAIETAINEANKKGITGRDITPYILATVANLTKGKSLAANIALIKNNAQVGTWLASRLAQIRRQHVRAYHSSTARQPVVVGGAVLDIICRPDKHLILETSNPGTATRSFGGVGRNVAEAMARMGAAPVLCTALGGNSDSLVAYCEQNVGMRVLTVDTKAQMPTYIAMLKETGDLVAAVADMHAFDDILPAPLTSLRDTKGSVCGIEDVLRGSPLLVIDANVPPVTIKHLLESAAKLSVPSLFECTSVHKCTRILDADGLARLSVLKPNQFELRALAEAVAAAWKLPSPYSTEEDTSNAAHEEDDNTVESVTETVDVDEMREKQTADAVAALQQLFQQHVTESSSTAAPHAADNNTISNNDDDNDETVLDYQTLSAAKLLLAAMITPTSGALKTPVIEGRKHLIATLGKHGVLWLSAPIAATVEEARRLAELPFFMGANDSTLQMDFVLCPAPKADMRKCTGAGDTLAGAVCVKLAGSARMKDAIAFGLGAAKVALEANTHASTIPLELSHQRVAEIVAQHVKPIEPSYE